MPFVAIKRTTIEDGLCLVFHNRWRLQSQIETCDQQFHLAAIQVLLQLCILLGIQMYAARFMQELFGIRVISLDISCLLTSVQVLQLVAAS